MITILVLEDEKKVYELLAQALKSEGYSFIDEAQSGGIIKIIKKAHYVDKSIFTDRILEFKTLVEARSGEVYKTKIGELEKNLIEAVLERTEGNQLKAARILGINRNTLRTKIKKLGISREMYKK